jgi:hypothetical protein
MRSDSDLRSHLGYRSRSTSATSFIFTRCTSADISHRSSVYSGWPGESVIDRSGAFLMRRNFALVAGEDLKRGSSSHARGISRRETLCGQRRRGLLGGVLLAVSERAPRVALSVRKDVFAVNTGPQSRAEPAICFCMSVLHADTFRSGHMRRRHLGLVTAFAFLALAAAQGQTATVCKDGTTTATTGRGACSRHGGVDSKATKLAAKAAKAATTTSVSKGEVAPAAVSCKDGTTSAPGRGACSHHGGVGSPPVPSTTVTPSLPAAVRPSSPARTRSEAKSNAPTATAVPKTPPASNRSASETTNPVGAIAQCKDGLYSHATSRRGACSRHGGVAQWLVK